MLYREIIAVCSEIHTKHINTLCGRDGEMLNVKPGGTYSDHCAVHIVTTGLKGLTELWLTIWQSLRVSEAPALSKARGIITVQITFLDAGRYVPLPNFRQ
jgi:hypothetical protein